MAPAARTAAGSSCLSVGEVGIDFAAGRILFVALGCQSSWASWAVVAFAADAFAAAAAVVVAAAASACTVAEGGPGRYRSSSGLAEQLEFDSLSSGAGVAVA